MKSKCKSFHSEEQKLEQQKELLKTGVLKDKEAPANLLNLEELLKDWEDKTKQFEAV